MVGFVQFDPDRREPSGDNDDAAAKPAKPAKVEAGLATLATLATLPADTADGLKRLARMAVPRGVRCPEVWPIAIADAQRLAAEGWASQALKLGWSALDLFGAVLDPAGNREADGLAVRLGGRKVLALCSTFATVDDGKGGRSYLYRGDAKGVRLLWELGRGR